MFQNGKKFNPSLTFEGYDDSQQKNMVCLVLAVIAVVFQNGKNFVPSLTFDGNAKSLRIGLHLYRSSLVVFGLGLKCFQLQTR